MVLINTIMEYKLNTTPAPANTIFFSVDENQTELLKLCQNGDIFVKGRLVENDKEVVDALREFLISQGFGHLNKNKDEV